MAPVVLDFHGLAFWRHDRGGAPGSDVAVALAGNGGNLLIVCDLVEQFGQRGCVADLVGSEFRSSDFQGFSLIPKWILRQTLHFLPPF
jgi:hypothetical protein